MRIVGQQFVCAASKGTEDRCRLRFAEPVGPWWLIVDRLIHGFTSMVVFAGDLPLTLAFQVVGPTNGFAFFHSNHLQFSYRYSEWTAHSNDSRNQRAWLLFSGSPLPAGPYI